MPIVKSEGHHHGILYSCVLEFVFINKGWPDNAAYSRALDIHFSASTASCLPRRIHLLY